MQVHRPLGAGVFVGVPEVWGAGQGRAVPCLGRPSLGPMVSTRDSGRSGAWQWCFSEVPAVTGWRPALDAVAWSQQGAPTSPQASLLGVRAAVPSLCQQSQQPCAASKRPGNGGRLLGSSCLAGAAGYSNPSPTCPGWLPCSWPLSWARPPCLSPPLLCRTSGLWPQEKPGGAGGTGPSSGQVRGQPAGPPGSLDGDRTELGPHSQPSSARFSPPG